MAYEIVKRDVDLNQVGTEITAVLDAAEDLDSLGTNWAPGSTAIVAALGSTVAYINAEAKVDAAGAAAKEGKTE